MMNEKLNFKLTQIWFMLNLDNLKHIYNFNFLVLMIFLKICTIRIGYIIKNEKKGKNLNLCYKKI